MQPERSRLNTVSIHCLLILVLCAAACAVADATEAAGVLTGMEFSGSGRVLLRPDPTPDRPFAELAPRWNAGASRLAVAYQSGSVPVVSVTMEIGRRSMPERVMVRGIGPDGFLFAAAPAGVRSAGGNLAITYPPRPSSIPFDPGTVCCYDPFIVRWEISFDNGATWSLACESTAIVYVTHARPAPENPEMGYGYIESLFDISCRSANGAIDEHEIIDNVWRQFTMLAVCTKAGDTLAFYPHKHNNMQETTAGLILFKSGVCFAWAHLLIDLLRVQGVRLHNSYVVVSGPASTPYGPVIGMLMPNCTFTKPSAAADYPEFPYMAAFARPLTGDLIGPDVVSRRGIPAQGEPDPMALFHDHALVLIDGVYYDPSYGRTFASLDEFVNSIQGWVVESHENEARRHLDLDGNGKIENVEVKVARVSNDPRRCKLSVSRTDY